MIEELAIFGSALRVDFTIDSDIDVLVTFETEARWTLFDLTAMHEELRTIFSRKVDIVTREGLKSSRNYLRRKAIFADAEVIYAA